MAASRESFSSFQSFDGPSIQMGNNSKVQTKGKGSVKLEHGRFKDVLFVPSLDSNVIYLPDDPYLLSKASDLWS